MSFILDALRKSESERRQGAVPGITEVPLALQQHALPAWAVAVMIALGLGLVALAAAWWINVQPRAGAQVAATASQSAEPQPATPVPRAPAPASSASSSLAEAVRSAARPGPRDDATALERSAQTSADSASAFPPSRPAAREPAAAAAPASATASTMRAERLPNAAALVAEGVNVPDLRLQLHVYDDSAANRYVFINGNMYREGDTLREGPRLLRIERSGAVLRQSGREFLLSQ